MANIQTLQQALQKQNIILMDGGMGTEILNRGLKTTLPLWSADALLTHPDVVQAIHEDNIKAGAQIIITNTFMTTSRRFTKTTYGDRAKEATIIACQLAQTARKKTHTEDSVYIAGSVAPLEQCYHPELVPPDTALKKEHFALVSHLAEEGVDFILAETMNTIRETLAILEAAQEHGLPVAACFVCNDNEELLSGESLADAVKAVALYDPLFIGVNCVSHDIATRTVRALTKLTDKPIAVYAQGDGAPGSDQGWEFDETHRDDAYIKAATQWKADGATIIGGCCGTSPALIKRLEELC